MRRLATFALAMAVMSVGFAVARTAAAAPAPETVLPPWVGALCAVRGGPGGVGCLLRCSDAAEVEAVVRATGCFVLALQDDAESVQRLRKDLHARALLGARALVEVGDAEAIPLADACADWVAIPNLAPGELNALSSVETMRVLVPRGSLALVARGGTALAGEALSAWISRGGFDAAASTPPAGATAVLLRKPPTTGADNWGEWNHGADNNPVSTDSNAHWPLTMQWFGLPHHAMRTGFHLVAGGRYFFATVPTPSYAAITDGPGPFDQANTLIVRDAYNGCLLWTRPLPPASLFMHSVWIAADDRFFLTDGPDIVALDAANGKEVERLRVGDEGQQIKWMTLENGRFYALLGRPDASGYARRAKPAESPVGMGEALRAFDVQTKKGLWEHKEAGAVDGLGVGISAGRLFYYAPGICVTALGLDSGATLWRQADPEVLRKLAEPHTPGALDGVTGYRPGLLCTPEAVVLNMNSHKCRIAFSAKDGSILWQNDLLGGNQGRGGHMMALGELLLAKGMRPGICDLVSGKPAPDQKLAFGGGCGRFTASPYLLVGMLGAVYDRQAQSFRGQTLAKPDCHVGTFTADGLLFSPPGSCQCALPFRGTAVRASLSVELPAGVPTASRLQRFNEKAASLPTTENDWPSYRAGLARAAASRCRVGTTEPKPLWIFEPGDTVQPTAPVAVGDRVFCAGHDGRVVCLRDGKADWEFYTGGAILTAPAVADGRVYVGSMDGVVYCLSAVTGRLVWRFQAAPLDRRIMVYGDLSSKWPVTGGVVVRQGVAYAAAGLTDLDGLFVDALDAADGTVKWASENLGHLDAEHREGFTPLGRLAVAGNRLWVQTDKELPCAFDLATGTSAPCPSILKGRDGKPRLDSSGSRSGDVGLFAGRFLVTGGLRFWSSSWETTPDKGTAVTFLDTDPEGLGRYPAIDTGEEAAMLPAWDDGLVVMPVEQYRAPRAMQAWDAAKTVAWLDGARAGTETADARRFPFRKSVDPKAPKQPELKVWGPQRHAADAVALAADAVVVAERAAYDARARCFKEARLAALSRTDGSELWHVALPAAPLYNGVCIDRAGRIVVALVDGRIACYGAATRE